MLTSLEHPRLTKSFYQPVKSYVENTSFLSYFSLPKANMKLSEHKHCFCSSHEYNETYYRKKECSFIVDRSGLIHQPEFIPHLQVTPCLLMDEWLLNILPIHSIILTVWNQERIIEETLNALLKYTHGWWELIIVFDQCHDKSINIIERIVRNFVNECNRKGICSNPGLVHIRLINQLSGVSETSSNNIGMRASHPATTYFILVQDDIIIREYGWNSVLALPINLWHDVFSVSGRCGHSFFRGNHRKSKGRCGTNINRPLKMSSATRCAFYVCDTGNRGPLLLHAARTRLLGYLDEKNYWLGEDEHDLNFRAYISHRWVSGFQPIDFDAPLEFGGTRRKNYVQMTAEDMKYRELRITERNLHYGAIDKFKSEKWKNTTIMITIGPTLSSLNLYTYMKDDSNYMDLMNSRFEIRHILKDIMYCENSSNYQWLSFFT